MKTIELTDEEFSTLKRFLTSFSTQNLDPLVFKSIRNKLGVSD